MPDTILLPLDGSPLAELALPFAERLARATDAHIVAVRAIAPPVPAALQAEVESYLETVASRLRDQGLSVETVAPAGAPAAAILQEARARGAGMIVLSSHGRSGVGRWVYGSVADRVLRQAPVPVMLTAHADTVRWRPEQPLRMLVPLDGSVLGETALDSARELAQKLHAEMVLMRVVEPVFYDMAYHPPMDPAPELEAARVYLDTVAGQVVAGGSAVPVTVRVEFGQAVGTIAQVAAELPAGLIAMATHGRSGLARFVMGSVATGVLQRAGVPLLLVRPADAVASAPVRAGETLSDMGAADSHEAVFPVSDVHLSPDELDLVLRGLDGLLSRPGVDSDLARVQSLAERLRGPG